MKHYFKDEFIKIADLVLKENKTLEEWAEIESDDMFQGGQYVGGFDAAEMEFCFSVYINDKEYWFQIEISDIKKVAIGELKKINIKQAF